MTLFRHLLEMDEGASLTCIDTINLLWFVADCLSWGSIGLSKFPLFPVLEKTGQHRFALIYQHLRSDDSMCRWQV